MRFYIFIVFFGGVVAPVWAQIKLPTTLPDSLRSQIEQYIAFKVDSIEKSKTLIKAQIMPLPPKFKYNVALTGSLNSGNLDRKLLVFRSDFSWAGKVVSLDLHPRFSFGEQNRQLAEREPYIDALVNFFHQRKFYGFMATNMEASNLRGIHLRVLGGVGLGWHMIRTEAVKLSFTNLVLYETTDFITSEDLELWRSSARLKGQYSLFKNKITLKHWFYFQPSFTAKNFRWNGILSVEFPIYKNLQFRLNVEDVYESLVPEGRRNEDRSISLGLSFGRK